MKKINILIILGLFVLLVGAAQPAQAALTSTWAPSVSSISSTGGGKPDLFMKAVAQLNAATGKFEGLLNAYSINQNRARGSVKGEVEVGAVAYDSARRLSHALEQFNLALVEVYPTLSEEEQLDVLNAYQSLDLYLQDLVARTNSVLGRKAFKIEYGEPLSKTSNSTTRGRFIIIIDDLNSDV